MELFKRTCLALLLIMVMVSYANAQIHWVGIDQSTISWDAVTTKTSGDPIPTEDVIKYRIYSKKSPDGIEAVIGDTGNTQFTLIFAVEGRYLAGVQTVRIPQGETEEMLAEIVWSDSLDVRAVPVPFGIKFYAVPSSIVGLTP